MKKISRDEWKKDGSKQERMEKGRYRNDYELMEDLDEKGHVHITYRYKGDAYRFAAQPEKVRILKNQLPFRAATGWCFYFAGMGWRSNAMHSVFTAILYVLGALPLALFTETAFAWRKMREPLEHRHADRMNNRYPAAASGILVCSAAALAAGGVMVLRRGMDLPGDVLFLAACLGLLETGRWAFRQRKDVLLKKH